MKLTFILLGIFLFSCHHIKKKEITYPIVFFDKNKLLLYTQPDNFSFKFIQITKNQTKESIGFQFKSDSVTSFNLRDSIALKWPKIDRTIFDTLDYNIRIKINSANIYGFDMDFGYINRNKNADSIIILKPLLK